MTLSRPFLGGLLILCVAVVAASCGGIAKPQGWASPTIQNSTAYIFRNKDRLSAVTLQDGGGASVAWTFPAKGDKSQKDIKVESVYGDPIVDGDRIYFAGYEGEVFALDKSSGRLVWRLKAITGSIVGGPTLDGDRLVFGTTEGRLYVISRENGQTVPGWPATGLKVGDPVWATPIVKNGTIFIATMKGEVRAYRMADGSEAWPRPFDAGGAIAEISLIGDDTLFVPSFDKRVYLLKLSDGSPLFPDGFKTEDWVWNRPALQGNTAYFGDLAGNVYALDITKNSLAWSSRYDTKSKVKSGPAIAGDMLVVVDRKPEVHFLSLADGGPLGIAPILQAGTVRADVATTDQGMFVVTTGGRLFKVDPTQRSVSEVPVGANP